MKGERGSFSLEASLLFPFLMAVVFCFVWQMSAIRCDMMFRSIILKEAEKISVLGVLSEYSGELSTFLTGNETDPALVDTVMKGAYGLALKQQISGHYELLCSINRGFRSLITHHKEYIECEDIGTPVRLTVVYTLYTPFALLHREFRIPLRVWDHGDHSGKLNQSSDASVWDQDNFERGKILRRRFGGNLPFGFPVLSGFMNGNAVIIKSLDLTCETWTCPEDAFYQMNRSIGELAGYEGMPYPWGSEKIIIPPGSISRRIVKFIIPENTNMEDYQRVFAELKSSGVRNHVEVEIIPYQTS